MVGSRLDVGLDAGNGRTWSPRVAGGDIDGLRGGLVLAAHAVEAVEGASCRACALTALCCRDTARSGHPRSRGCDHRGSGCWQAAPTPPNQREIDSGDLR